MKSSNIVWQNAHVTSESRQIFFGHAAATLWMTGLSGAGKSTLAFATESRLLSMGIACFVLDGDNVRHGLNRDLGFSHEDRSENIRRVAEVARLMNDAGLIVITSFISPYREDRELARTIIGKNRFLEVHVATPLDVCEQRDVKGLYQRARTGEVREFTGINSPYEPPLTPDIMINTHQLNIDSSIDILIKGLSPHITSENRPI